MSRFLFVPSDDRFVGGNLLEMCFCKDCDCPIPFQQWHMICHGRYPRAELGGAFQCFMCGKTFDGNTSATIVTIELTKPKETK